TNNILLEFFRMAGRTLAYNAVIISQRAANFAGAVGGYYWTRSLTGVLVGITISDLAMTIATLLFCWRQGLWQPTRPSLSVIRSSLHFSAPVMLMSIGASLMSYADRYVLLAWSNSETVAHYVVPYDLCGLVGSLLVTGFRLSAMPEITRRYTHDGEQAAVLFIRNSLRHFTWLLVGACFGLIAVRRELILLMASGIYADSAALVPWIAPGVLLAGINFMINVVFHLK